MLWSERSDLKHGSALGDRLANPLEADNTLPSSKTTEKTQTTGRTTASGTSELNFYNQRSEQIEVEQGSTVQRCLPSEAPNSHSLLARDLHGKLDHKVILQS